MIQPLKAPVILISGGSWMSAAYYFTASVDYSANPEWTWENGDKHYFLAKISLGLQEPILRITQNIQR